MAKRKVKTAVGEEVEVDEAVLQGGQVWEEEAHENPFDNIWQAKILEVRTNADGVLYAFFTAYRKDQPDIKEPHASLPEDKFLERFAKKISPL